MEKITGKLTVFFEDPFRIHIGTVTLNVAWTVSNRKIISFSKSIKRTAHSSASITGFDIT